jgi:hypothetical protein
MKYYIDTVCGAHCFYWNKNGFWLVEEEELQNFIQLVKEQKEDGEVDYQFCYEEILDYFKLFDWDKVPQKKKEKIINYLIQFV